MTPQNPAEAALSSWLNLLQNLSEAAQPHANQVNDDSASFPFAVPAFIEEVQREAWQRTNGFLEGVQAVANARHHTRRDTAHKVIWQHGHCRLLDYAPHATTGTAIFIVPSLINRYTILDLHPTHSFVAYLVRKGFRPLVLDWGEVDDDTLSYSCADFISGKAMPAFAAARESHDGPLALLGYCMGGVFAVSMAQLLRHNCDALLLLATPWDFSAPDSPRIPLLPPAVAAFRASLSAMNPVPSHVISLIFHLIDPWSIQKRYERFATLDESERELFLSVEHWLSEGVDLPRTVATETFVDWPHANILHTGQFTVGRTWVEPQRISCPAFAVIPAHDKIVPTSCAMPLARRLPKCTVLQPQLGHVSMMASTKATTEMWQPLADWLKHRF